ncbi:D-sedoheptulose-7-phosphate isomerase [Sediminibacterium sp.]|uniref:D-sedoheptulose-7-phosphate isomerase n=1 Tax=Sediminibacterium sp. TaxID=1917865 RepID=UPI003F6FD44D
MLNRISDIIQESIAVKQSLLSNPVLLEQLSLVVESVTTAFKNGHKVQFCGNGGSAADAQHLAAEFSGRFYKNRQALPSDALHCNSSYLTAVANDYGYDEVYSRLVEGTMQEGDILIGLSTSGNSPNIVKAFETAKVKNITTVGFTGNGGGKLGELSQFLLDIPSNNTPRIQESHIMLGHIICELVEANLFP